MDGRATYYQGRFSSQLLPESALKLISAPQSRGIIGNELLPLTFTSRLDFKLTEIQRPTFIDVP